MKNTLETRVHDRKLWIVLDVCSCVYLWSYSKTWMWITSSFNAISSYFIKLVCWMLLTTIYRAYTGIFTSTTEYYAIRTSQHLPPVCVPGTVIPHIRTEGKMNTDKYSPEIILTHCSQCWQSWCCIVRQLRSRVITGMPEQHRIPWLTESDADMNRIEHV